IGTLIVNANQTGNGNLTVLSNFTVGTLDLETTGANNIVFSNDVVANNVFLTTTGGNITQSGGFLRTTGPTGLTIAFNSLGTNATFGSATNNINRVNTSGLGNGLVTINNSSNALTLGTLGSATNLTATAGSVTTAANITTTGAINLTTPSLTNGFVMSASDINVTTASNLSVNGPAGGTFNATGGGQEVNFTTTNPGANPTIDLFGDMTFISQATLTTPAGGTIYVHSGSDVLGQQQLTLVTCNLVLEGTIDGNPLVFNSLCGSGTIINNNGAGDVNLGSNLTFNGENLAIIAKGNINTTGLTTINLNGTGVNGGILTMIAGFDSSPATPGQVQNGNVTYTIGAPTVAGGSINLAGVTITTTSNTGVGGNVTAVANGGTLNNGTIALGNITTNGVTAGGNVTVWGEGGVSVGDITTTGTTAGNVSLQVAQPIISGTMTVLDGSVSGGTFGVAGT
ncbi:MAG: hypothetical protein KIT69_19845, partial [Propionibacteriaceae bacterium]|nr:hypothetical protein [Propionibacteriaceae bacterium]